MNLFVIIYMITIPDFGANWCLDAGSSAVRFWSMMLSRGNADIILVVTATKKYLTALWHMNRCNYNQCMMVFQLFLHGVYLFELHIKAYLRSSGTEEESSSMLSSKNICASSPRQRSSFSNWRLVSLKLMSFSGTSAIRWAGRNLPSHLLTRLVISLWSLCIITPSAYKYGINSSVNNMILNITSFKLSTILTSNM